MVLVVLVSINIILTVTLIFKLSKINNVINTKQKEILHDIKFIHNDIVLTQQLILDKLINIEKDINKLSKEINITNILSLL